MAYLVYVYHCPHFFLPSLVHVAPGMLAYNFYQIVRKDAAALKIQTDWRWHKFNQNYSRLKKATITMQAIIRAIAARKQYDFTKHNKTATVIQVI